jgi:hypothetical protein
MRGEGGKTALPIFILLFRLCHQYCTYFGASIFSLLFISTTLQLCINPSLGLTAAPTAPSHPLCRHHSVHKLTHVHAKLNELHTSYPLYESISTANISYLVCPPSSHLFSLS